MSPVGWFRKKKNDEGSDPYGPMLAFMAAADGRGFMLAGLWCGVAEAVITLLTIIVAGLGLLALGRGESPAPDFLLTASLVLFTGFNAALFVAMLVLCFTRRRDLVRKFRLTLSTLPAGDDAAAGETMAALMTAMQRCLNGNSFLLFFSSFMGLFVAASLLSQAANAHHPAAWLNLLPPLWFLRSTVVTFPRRRVYLAFFVKHFLEK